MTMSKSSRLLLVALAFIIICELAGAFGSVFTIPSIPTWYASLAKPSFNPPNWLFGPVWLILYALMGISAYLIYEKRKNKAVTGALVVFAVQLVLNVLWSAVFFGLHSALLGLLTIILLWIAIAITMVKFYGILKQAAWLLIPYLLWVSFAALLNFSIWQLN